MSSTRDEVILPWTIREILTDDSLDQQYMKIISNIVFTKNRPLQLDGYLESLYRHFPAELIQTYVLYKQELFEEQYRQLFSKYLDCVVVKENDFHSDLLKIITQVDTKYILFGIDDVVYFDSVDFKVIDETFDKCSEDILGFDYSISFRAMRYDLQVRTC
jgi:hypothetical protein